MLSAGTTRSSSSRPLRSVARPTSRPSGRRKTKSPNAKFSTMKRLRSARSVFEYLRRNIAPTSRAPSANSTREDWSRIGRSGTAARAMRASSKPAPRAEFLALVVVVGEHDDRDVETAPLDLPRELRGVHVAEVDRGEDEVEATLGLGPGECCRPARDVDEPRDLLERKLQEFAEQQLVEPPLLLERE